MNLSLKEAHELAVAVLVKAGTSPANAAAVARALVAAEADGLASHGMSRLPAYAAQVRSGKVDGQAAPTSTHTGTAAVRIDAADGFAFPALELAVEELAALTPITGVSVAAIAASHHFGAAGYHVEALANRGLVALAFSNSPAAIAPAGGRSAIFGTNPIAMGAPMGAGKPPLVIDLSLSVAARGKIMVAAQRGEAIPGDWALDAEGQPTTDAKAALAGTMLPIGGAKGAALAFVVEVLTASLTGSSIGHEAGSFFTAGGVKPRIGQLVLAFAPGPLSGGHFPERMAAMAAAILGQQGTRLPGERRLALREKATLDGVNIPTALLEELRGLA
ncbi:Ldh family oxidoreductase [Lacibacterium aquatile]|uniref:Ldh family oxidoreductase n=1 Tax=Lacibacterium aquatile TaxID=1168082 RepID=A0ABW5DSH2_9PROT